VHGTNPPNKTENVTPDKTEILTNKQITRVEVNGQSDPVHPAGQRAQSLGRQEQPSKEAFTGCFNLCMKYRWNHVDHYNYISFSGSTETAC